MRAMALTVRRTNVYVDLGRTLESTDPGRGFVASLL